MTPTARTKTGATTDGAPWRSALRTLSPSEQRLALLREMVRRVEQRKKAARHVKYFADPVGFCKDILGVNLWSRQQDIASAIPNSRRVYVRSGHKIGKTILAACLALWWIATRKRALVILTSGNKQQVKSQIWRELRKVYFSARCAESIGGNLHRDPSAGLTFEDGRAIYGITADEPEKIAGYSSDQLLFVIDEASGFPDELHEAVLGNLGGGGREVNLGNPTRLTGYYARAFRSGDASIARLHVDSRESPNIATPGSKRIRGLATPGWVRMMEKEFPPGEGNPGYDVRVCGDFAELGGNNVFTLKMLSDAVKRWHDEKPDLADRLVIGVDVARFGPDDSAFAPRRGTYAYPIVVEHGFDTVAVSARVLKLASELRHERDAELPLIVVDSTGLGGGVEDLLRKHPKLVQVIGCDSATKAVNAEKFHSTRDEGWWGLREWIEAGGCLPPDKKRDEELLAARYGTDGQLRIQVSGKDAIKALVKRSPDRADATWLSVRRVSPMRPARGTGQGSDARRLGTLI